MNITKMHDYSEKLNASRAGYDQGDRWSFNPARDGLSIVDNRECDCSSSCAAIARAGGWPVDTRDPIYTGNFKQKFEAAGFDPISVRGNSLSTLLSKLQPGDFLLGPGHVVYVREVNRWWSAESDERGRKSGGRAGDQTGMEARFRGPYARSKGWEWILRPVVMADPMVSTKPDAAATVLAVEPRAIEWRTPPQDLVRIVQEITGAVVDGVRGPKTVTSIKAWQRLRGLTADGYFGAVSAETYLMEQPNLYKGRAAMHAPAVKLVQWIVRSRVDGEFGDLTETDVKSAQAWAGLAPDGVVGNQTKVSITR